MNPSRGRLALPSLLLWILLLLISAETATALDPSQPVSSYIQTRFTDSDGVAGNIVNDIVQSRDGFLWLLVGTGVMRFDGRHFSNFDRPVSVRALALAPDGDLWIGTNSDLERIPAATLNQFDRLSAISYHPISGSRGVINCLHFSQRGTLWVGTTAGLYRFESGVFSPVIQGMYIQRIEDAASGHLLVVTSRGFIELDGSRTVPHPELATQLGVKTTNIFHVFEDSHGVTWFCTANGVARRIGGSIEKLAPWGPQGHGVFRVYEDAQGTLWFAGTEGLLRATTAGLELAIAGMNVRYMYGDQEGDLWVGTNGDGLFRFKDRAARMFTKADGLPTNVVQTVLAAHDGAVWAGLNCGGIARFDGQRFQVYNENNGLLNSCVWALAEDVNHDLWIGTWGGGVFRFHDGKFIQYSKAQGVAGDIVNGIIAAQDGSVWLKARPGLSRFRDGKVRNYTVADGLSDIHTVKLYQDRTGGIWVGTLQGLDHLVGDRFVNVFPLPQHEVFPMGEDRSGVLYVGVYPDGKIYRVEDNQVIGITSNIVAEEMVETEQGDLWLTGDSIARVPPGGLNHPHQQDEPFDLATFGPTDGLTSTEPNSGQPDSALTPDGKLWIATTEGLAMLDLPHLPTTDRKPTIYMEEITVGRNQHRPGPDLVLPPGTHHIELNFDAIEISSPEKIRMQYRLDSVDSEWLDAQPSGHAIYSTIPPGTHAFHVRACNRSGIWDRTGVVYSITQQPYFYQTRWFLAATIALGLLVIAGLYQLRMRQVARTLSARFEGRLAERTRIARELHDTLLQSFSALLLRLQTAVKVLPARPEDAKQRVETAIDLASNAIAEGRDAVHELRSERPADSDLAQAIGNLGRELLSGPVNENPPEFRVQVEGTPRNLNPMVRDEAYRIAAEALRNAITHSGARRIEVETRYDDQQFRVRIRDDGEGIDPGVLEQGHAPGHWGLRGMRERAKLLGGNLEVWSQAGSGSEVELTIPAASAYAKPPASGWFVYFRRWWS